MTAQAQIQPARSSLLRRTLQANGVFSLLSGLLLTLDAGPIAALIGLPAPGALTAVGLVTLGYAALLFLATRREPIDRRHALGFVAADAAWVLASAALLLGGWVPFSTAGVWAVLIVADIVAVFAVLQYAGLRRAA